MIKLENVGKIYSSNGNIAVGIRKVNLEFNIGEFVAITGESGSGKSTLLNVISGVDTYEEGEMYINGEETSYYDINDLENYRNKYVGFIFQNYNIIDSYTVLQNVEASLLFNSVDKNERRKKALELIDRVGLSSKINVKSSKLSGGEKQRVVIARALAKDPLIIAADEPTGNLDSESSREVVELLYEISKNKLVLMVTHDFEDVKDYATREIRIFDGEVQEDKNLKEIAKNSENIEDVEQEPEKLKSKDLVNFALKDLFASPKRFIFYFLVLFAFILYTFAYVCFDSYLLSDLDRNEVYTDFHNQDPYRIILSKKDKTPFSAEELKELKHQSDVRDIINFDPILDCDAYGYIINEEDRNNDLYVYGYMMPASFLKESDLVAGRLPNKKGEVVLTFSYEFDDTYSSFSSIIDKTIEFNSYLDGYKMNEYSCVGVINGQNNSSKEVNYIYYYEEDLIEKLYKYYFNNSLKLNISSGSGSMGTYYDQLSYFENIEISADLMDNEFYTSHFYASDGSTNPYNVKFYDTYGEIYSGSLNFKNISSSDYGIIYLSSSLYNEINNKIKDRIYNTPYQVSLYVSNASKIEKVASKLSQDYICIVPSHFENKNFDLSGLYKGLLFLEIIFSTAQEFLFLFLIFLHSMKAKKKDVEILRTIGATHNTIKRMVRFQLMSIGIVIYALCLTAILVFRSLATGMIKMALNTLSVPILLLLFLVVIVLTYLLSAVFTRILFKKSVKKALDER